ncbi:MAG TPA: hypothetical protein VF981_06615 [Gemmatimonadaceae bacterium]
MKNLSKRLTPMFACKTPAAPSVQDTHLRATGVTVMRTALVSLLVTLAPLVAGAQELRSTGADTACGCRIVLQKLAQLGRAEDTIAILGSSTVARDSRGRFYVGGILPYAGVAVFDSAGRHLATMGRAGNGPGELSRVRYVRTIAGDTLLVHDDHRMTVFDPTGAYLRAALLPAGPRAFRFTPLGDGQVVLNNYFPTHAAFVLLGRNHEVVREFGKSVGGDRFGSDELQFRVADVGGGRFAAVQQYHRFLVQIWDTNGRLVREFNRSPPWFPRYTREQRRPLGFASRYPVVMGAWGDIDQRHLWLVASVPDPSWKEPACNPLPGAPRGEGSRCAPIPMSAQQRAWDTIVEVLDLDTGRVLVSQRFDEDLTGFMEGGLLYALRENDDGLMVIDVWRARIVPGS